MDRKFLYSQECVKYHMQISVYSLLSMASFLCDMRWRQRNLGKVYTLWNSVGETSSSCIACEMILAMLSNLLWARSLMESCFSFFTVKVLKDFHVMTIARERSKLVPLGTMPTGRPTSLASAAIEISPVITVDVIKPVFTMPVIVLHRFIFSAVRSRTSISSRKKCFNFSQFIYTICLWFLWCCRI